MTDLERAQSILRSMEAAIHPAMREVFVKCMVHSLAAARREGAEGMREKAAIRALEERRARGTLWDLACKTICNAIRNLPLTPEEQ